MDQDNQLKGNEPERSEPPVNLEKRPVVPNVTVSVEKNTSGMEMASLILGIFSIVTVCCCGLGIILGGLAILFGCLSRKNKKMSGMALAGVITGAVGLALGIPGVILSIAFWIGVMEDLIYSESLNMMRQIGVALGGMFA